MKRAFFLIACVVVLAVLVGLRPAAQAHALCTEYWCCSPHGAYTSDTGCYFSECGYWDRGSPWGYMYSRNVYCYPGSGGYNSQLCGCSGQDQCNGSAIIDVNHGVGTYGFYCCNHPDCLDG